MEEHCLPPLHIGMRPGVGAIPVCMRVWQKRQAGIRQGPQCPLSRHFMARHAYCLFEIRSGNIRLQSNRWHKQCAKGDVPLEGPSTHTD